MRPRGSCAACLKFLCISARFSLLNSLLQLSHWHSCNTLFTLCTYVIICVPFLFRGLLMAGTVELELAKVGFVPRTGSAESVSLLPETQLWYDRMWAGAGSRLLLLEREQLDGDKLRICSPLDPLEMAAPVNASRLPSASVVDKLPPLLKLAWQCEEHSVRASDLRLSSLRTAETCGDTCRLLERFGMFWYVLARSLRGDAWMVLPCFATTMEVIAERKL